jgi:hypothetical protein
LLQTFSISVLLELSPSRVLRYPDLEGERMRLGRVSKTITNRTLISTQRQPQVWRMYLRRSVYVKKLSFAIAISGIKDTARGKGGLNLAPNYIEWRALSGVMTCYDRFNLAAFYAAF